MPVNDSKLLRFPNARQLRSDQIHRVQVYPDIDISPEFLFPYVRVVDGLGLVYEGLVDLNHLEVSQGTSVTTSPAPLSVEVHC